VHEPRVLERHAEAARERGQQADVVLAERVRPVEVLERDAPTNLISGHQRSHERRARRLSLGDLLLCTTFREPGLHVVRDDRCLRLENRLPHG
jgi:hypothetical protein